MWLRFRDFYDLRRVLVGELKMISTVIYHGQPRRQYFIRAVQTSVVPGFVQVSVASLVPEILRCHQAPRIDWFLSTLNYVTSNRFHIEQDTHHDYNHYLVSTLYVSVVSPSSALAKVTRLVDEHVYYAGIAELLA